MRRPGTGPRPDGDERFGDDWPTLAVLCLSVVLVVANNTSLTVALPPLQEALHATPSELEWVVDTYGLVFAGFLLPAGAIADRVGRKLTLQLGLAVFGAGSLLATFATEPWHLVVLRGTIGLGAAFVMPSTLSTLTHVFSGYRRARAIGVWSGFAGVGGALGSVTSGALLERYWWGAAFLINVPIVALALTLGVRHLPESRDPEHVRLDPVGAVLAVVGFASLLFGIIEGPGHGWTSPETLSAFAVSVVGFVAFVAWERRVDHPMLEMTVFRIREFDVSAVTITLSFFTIFGLSFVLIQYLQLVLRYSPLVAGAAMLPRAAGQLFSAPRSASTVRRLGPRVAVAGAIGVAGTGLLVLSRAGASTPYWWLALGLVLVGLGSGHTNAPSTVMIMESVRAAKAGVGSAVNDATREVGGALGIAVLGTVFASVYRTALPGRIDALGLATSVREQAAQSIVATNQVAATVGGATGAELERIGRETMTHAFDVTMLVAVAVLALAAGIVVVLQRRDPVVASPPSSEPPA